MQPVDAAKHRAVAVVGDAKASLALLDAALGDWKAPRSWSEAASKGKGEWLATGSRYTAPTNAPLPSDAEVLGALMRCGEKGDVVVCAAGGLPGELHKLWSPCAPLGYHVEYGFSFMGYEIAGGLAVKMALPDREVIVTVGDGSYLMMNSELATSVMLGKKITVVLNDNRGYGCINRLQEATGGAPFNNLLRDTRLETLPDVDFVAHARSLGARAVKVASIAELEEALKKARTASTSQVIVIDTYPGPSTDAGGAWWVVAVPAVSTRKEGTMTRGTGANTRRVRNILGRRHKRRKLARGGSDHARRQTGPAIRRTSTIRTRCRRNPISRRPTTIA